MSLTSILSIARSALGVHQRALSTISHNVANATTEGYSRQETPLRAGDPFYTPQGALGTGVIGEAARRIRDGFIDTGFRREAGLEGQSATMRDLLGQLEGVLGEPGPAGLSASLGAFFDAFSELANDPNGGTTRFLARQAAQSLAQRFRELSDGLQQAQDTALAQLQDKTARTNLLLEQVASLNQQIVAARGNGGVPDLEDQRDLALDRLSALIGIRTIDYGNGTIAVVAGDSVLADGAGHAVLAVAPAGAGFGVVLEGSSAALPIAGGEIKALTDFSQGTVPGLRGRLDSLAGSLASSVNALHQAGVVTGSQPAATNVPFFDPLGLTAASIDLSAGVKASPGNIVTGATGQPGDGSIALQIAQLRRSALPALGGQSAGDYYAGVVAELGGMRQSAGVHAEAQGVLVAGLTAQRASASGVNTDEEMIALMRGQQAYAAAARIITVADEMMQDMLRMI